MRFTIALAACLAYALRRAVALPAPNELEARGNAVSGNAGNAYGGSVIINGDPLGFINNTNGSGWLPEQLFRCMSRSHNAIVAVGGNGGFSYSGNAYATDGGDASSGNAGDVDGGSVTVSGGTIFSDNSTRGGDGGTSRSGNAYGGDASFNFTGFSGFIPFTGFD